MRLPRFLRQLRALYLTFTGNQYGGLIYDYKNGKLEQIHQFSDNKGCDEGMEIIKNLINGYRDEVYIVVIKCGVMKGYFAVESNQSGIFPWFRAFWPGVYEFEEALADTLKKARAVADKMGYRKTEEL